MNGFKDLSNFKEGDKLLCVKHSRDEFANMQFTPGKIYCIENHGFNSNKVLLIKDDRNGIPGLIVDTYKMLALLNSDAFVKLFQNNTTLSELFND